ncbi:MAG TPA: extracellular solute-binding protein [Candidatus Nanoarchaeia archaeon]|nr:extracellular solute-binding protein [Candidatus Nanoarchaeia archaeon]
MKNKIFALFLIFSFLLTAGAGCSNTVPPSSVKPVTLTYWRVYDDEDAFAAIIANYQKIHPYVTIQYKKFRYDEYEKELINALAEDRGPDIFSIPSAWVREYQNKIVPLPPQLTLVYPVVQGTIKKTTVAQLRTTPSLSLKDLKTNFVDVVYNDAVLNTGGADKIYGLPLYLDTMAMYYNTDLFNNAGISQPPAYWDSTFQQDVKKLTVQNNQGNIIQAGVALGGSANIQRPQDILSLLMMQNGAIMENNGSALFQTIPPGSPENYNPGLEALRFYTDFSNPAKDVYCWNGNLPNSLTMFEQGNLAMMFDYAYDLPTIKAAAPKLNFAIAKMPQIQGNTKQVNYANYWLETVSAKSKNINEAWDFVQFETSQDQVQNYLKVAQKPTALRALINSQVNDLNIGVFADQVLTAQSWYQGKNPLAAENAFQEMIDLTVKDAKDISAIINQEAAKVQQTIQ